jgi:hypothetical protein
LGRSGASQRRVSCCRVHGLPAKGRRQGICLGIRRLPTGSRLWFMERGAVRWPSQVRFAGLSRKCSGTEIRSRTRRPAGSDMARKREALDAASGVSRRAHAAMATTVRALPTPGECLRPDQDHPLDPACVLPRPAAKLFGGTFAGANCTLIALGWPRPYRRRPAVPEIRCAITPFPPEPLLTLQYHDDAAERDLSLEASARPSKG